MKNHLTALALLLVLFMPGCGGHGASSDQTDFFSASSVATGDNHACARLADGTVKCWGLNSSGQLGNSSFINAFRPVAVTGVSTASQAAAGGRHSCALLADGTLRCWGDNTYGQLGNSTTTGSNTPVAVTGIATATAVSAGENHACALLADKTLRCWGDNSYGQLGNSTSTGSNTPVAVTGITTATAVSAGDNHTCALLSDGTLRCWGLNIFGQLGNSSFLNASAPVTVTGITAASGIASGSNHTCSTLTDGTVRCWGDNSAGQLGIFWPLVGAVYLTTSSSPVQVSLTSAVGVAAGLYHSCARLSDSRVVCWGDNSAGQLGKGDYVGFTPPGPGVPLTTITPVLANSVTTATGADAGYRFSCSRLSSGKVFCWGNNTYGQLGSGTGISSMTPTEVVK